MKSLQPLSNPVSTFCSSPSIISVVAESNAMLCGVSLGHEATIHSSVSQSGLPYLPLPAMRRAAGERESLRPLAAQATRDMKRFAPDRIAAILEELLARTIR